MTSVITRISGGLGNQLFQLAAGLALSRARSAALRLDLAWYKNIRPQDTRRTFELPKLGVAVGCSTFLDTLRAKAAKKLGVMSVPLTGMTYLREAGAVRLNQYADRAGNIYLDGYWQDYHYAEDSQPEIQRWVSPVLSTLTAPDPIPGWTVSTGDERVAVHVRRGDYVDSLTASSKHGCCDPAYYHSAIQTISGQTSSRVKLFFFSDDLGWCKRTFSAVPNAFFVEAQGPDAHLREFAIMGLCDHFIIANSTFSWWAAFLSRNDRKCVIAPSKWFADSSMGQVALIPPSWLMI